MSNEPNGFAKYLVIFVDILGSQNRVDFQETYKINKIFHEELERNKQNDMMHTVYFRKIYTFSDCAYIFYGFKDGISDERKDEGELFKVALCNCEPIFLRFIKERILFRGGISYGDAYVDPSKSMFFGDAVNKAYKMESEIAIHPRIGYMIAYGVTCLFIIIILISLSKLLFTLAKSFMVEAIRCSDRIHAISFGKFFLDAYGAEASREEVLKAFSSWNIDNGSTSFRNQSGEDYDPKIADIINILKK